MIPLIWAHGAEAAPGDPPLPALRAALAGTHAITAPDLGPPDAAAWTRTLSEALQAQPDAVLVGHSLGGSHLLKTLAELGPRVRPRGMIGLASPFWGAPDWDSPAFALPAWAPEALAHVPIRLFHARDDAVVPFDHLALWAGALPRARTYPLEPPQGHGMTGPLAPVAMAIAEL